MLAAHHAVHIQLARAGWQRGPSARTDHRPAVTLTPRECEVLGWCERGKTSWEIGRILGITERTVNFHVYQAADKLGVRGRCNACARARALGLLPRASEDHSRSNARSTSA